MPHDPADQTWDKWATEQEAKERREAQKRERVHRLREFDNAFAAVRGGMPETGDDRPAALEFVGRWARLARLLDANPELVDTPFDQIAADPASLKGYALQVVLGTSPQI
jgi:hypothetical protein